MHIHPNEYNIYMLHFDKISRACTALMSHAHSIEKEESTFNYNRCERLNKLSKCAVMKWEARELSTVN